MWSLSLSFKPLALLTLLAILYLTPSLQSQSLPETTPVFASITPTPNTVGTIIAGTSTAYLLITPTVTPPDEPLMPEPHIPQFSVPTLTPSPVPFVQITPPQQMSCKSVLLRVIYVMVGVYRVRKG